MDNKDLEMVRAIIKEMQPVTKKVGPTWSPGHGTGGIFSFPGLEPDVVNAMIMPKMGLMDILPSRTSNLDNPLYGIFTGVTASVGSEPTDVCDNPPVVGLSKLCTHKFNWGRISRMSKVLDIDRFGRTRDRSDFTDLNMIGNPLAVTSPFVAGTPNAADVLKSDIAKTLFEFAVAFGRDFGHALYDGSPANNTAGGGYKEPYGLDILINTGYQDAENDQACPAADSDVRSFNDLEVNTHGEDAVRLFTNVYRNRLFVAQRAELMPVKWVWAMSWALFYELTEVWPCSYLSYRCKTQDTGMIDAVPSINPADQTALRDGMRQGQYLLIDGQQIPVVLDDFIAEDVLAGETFESSAYLVPVSVLGGRPATFMEYMNWDAPGAAIEAARTLGYTTQFWTSNSGRYLWHAKPPVNFCIQYLAKAEWRVILETPHIAARITDIRYTPVKHQRGSLPSDSSFYVNGGRTARDIYVPSYYPPTHGAESQG